MFENNHLIILMQDRANLFGNVIVRRISDYLKIHLELAQLPPRFRSRRAKHRRVSEPFPVAWCDCLYFWHDATLPLPLLASFLLASAYFHPLSALTPT